MLNSFDAVAQYRAIKVSVNVDFLKVVSIGLWNLLWLWQVSVLNVSAMDVCIRFVKQRTELWA
jgi:hypothetical protein